MKKLFTLVALLACFLGAKAEWVQDYTIDYSSYKGFPFYVMGYVPEWVGGVMTDYGSAYRYATQEALDGDGDDKLKDTESVEGSTTTENGTEYKKVTGAGAYWHQYFIADGIPTGDLADTYVVKAVVKASKACTVHVNMGNWSSAVGVDVNLAASDDFQEVEWDVQGVSVASCFLVAQPGTSDATIEWKSVTVGHNQKQSRPTVWKEWLTSDGQPVVVTEGLSKISTYMGNAETPWADKTVKFDDAEKNYLVCAWSKEKGRNMNEKDGWDPFPADIVDDPDDATNKVFICDGQPATTDGDPSAWDNQFWIQSPKEWKSGDQIKIHFRYKCDKASVKTNTQIHNQTPSNYLIWHAIGDVTFTDKWQEFDGTMTIADDMAGGWSIAFNLNPEVKDAVKFYFDDLSWQTMVLDEGYFVAGANPEAGLAYDFDEAIQFEEGVDLNGEACLVATVGTKDAYVSQVMISTIRGNDAAFKSNTLKPSGDIVDLKEDADAWNDYTAASQAKINLPGVGIWKVYLDPEYKSVGFEMLEGTKKEMKEIKPNETLVTINGLEREDLQDGKDNDGKITVKEEADDPNGVEVGTEGHKGQAWDNQFFLVANRALATGEVTIVQFKYKASKAAKSTTQLHGDPGAYKHWAAIGDVNFTEEWQDFEAKLTVPSEANEMKSIAFNLAEIKEACVYEMKDFVWKLEDGSESLIDETGTKNFFVKEGAGTTPYEFGGENPNAINTIVAKKNGTAVIYNLAGQRVSKDYKGLVVKEGKKFAVK